ncbi:hypothetical protein EBR66_05280 [bacterium]|nr:hypothetical protein [bacterium]
MSMDYNPQRGVTIMLVVVFMGVFLILLGTITSFAFTQARYGRALLAREQAINVAEAGLEYYRWFLAHYPNDLQNGTGQPGPYSYTVSDPEGGNIGTASLTVSGNSSCGVVQSIDITSQGTSVANPTYKRTVFARYAKPSVAEFSNVLNSNVWAGAGRTITGPYFSNGGIRMDATNNSTVSSAVSTWLCDTSYGCSPANNNAPGVFGSGSGSALWSYPAASFNFTGIASNFESLRTYAGNSGILLDATLVRVGGVQQGGTFASVGGTDQRGYHLIFNSNGTVTVYLVTGTSWRWGTHIDTGTQVKDYHTITAETLKGTYTIPATCALVYAQGKVWIEGTISGKVTLVAADTGSYDPDIIINNNITYATLDGTSGFTAIAERSVLYPPIIPNNTSVRGIFVADKGYYGRNLYDCTNAPYDKRNSLTINGTVVSNGRIVLLWGYSGGSCGSNTSGFSIKNESYDRLQAFLPPPFTPAYSNNYKFIVWREQ